MIIEENKLIIESDEEEDLIIKFIDLIKESNKKSSQYNLKKPGDAALYTVKFAEAVGPDCENVACPFIEIFIEQLEANYEVKVH